MEVRPRERDGFSECLSECLYDDLNGSHQWTGRLRAVGVFRRGQRGEGGGIFPSNAQTGWSVWEGEKLEAQEVALKSSPLALAASHPLCHRGPC